MHAVTMTLIFHLKVDYSVLGGMPDIVMKSNGFKFHYDYDLKYT